MAAGMERGSSSTRSLPDLGDALRRLRGRCLRLGRDARSDPANWSRWSAAIEDRNRLLDQIARVLPTTIEDVVVRYEAIAMELIDEDVILDAAARRRVIALRRDLARLAARARQSREAICRTSSIIVYEMPRATRLDALDVERPDFRPSPMEIGIAAYFKARPAARSSRHGHSRLSQLPRRGTSYRSANSYGWSVIASAAAPYSLRRSEYLSEYAIDFIEVLPRPPVNHPIERVEAHSTP